MEHQLDGQMPNSSKHVCAHHCGAVGPQGRVRRELVGDGGNLLIVAVDHGSRHVGCRVRPLAVAGRYTLLDR